jgi:hypothetical protein
VRFVTDRLGVPPCDRITSNASARLIQASRPVRATDDLRAEPSTSTKVMTLPRGARSWNHLTIHVPRFGTASSKPIGLGGLPDSGSGFCVPAETPAPLGKVPGVRARAPVVTERHSNAYRRNGDQLVRRANGVHVVGGSIIGAYYMAHQGDFSLFEGKIREVLSRGLAKPMAGRLLSLLGIKIIAAFITIGLVAMCTALFKLLVTTAGLIAPSWLLNKFEQLEIRSPPTSICEPDDAAGSRS